MRGVLWALAASLAVPAGARAEVSVRLDPNGGVQAIDTIMAPPDVIWAKFSAAPAWATLNPLGDLDADGVPARGILALDADFVYMPDLDDLGRAAVVVWTHRDGDVERLVVSSFVGSIMYAGRTVTVTDWSPTELLFPAVSNGGSDADWAPRLLPLGRGGLLVWSQLGRRPSVHWSLIHAVHFNPLPFTTSLEVTPPELLDEAVASRYPLPFQAPNGRIFVGRELLPGTTLLAGSDYRWRELTAELGGLVRELSADLPPAPARIAAERALDPSLGDLPCVWPQQVDGGYDLVYAFWNEAEHVWSERRPVAALGDGVDDLAPSLSLEPGRTLLTWQRVGAWYQSEWLGDHWSTPVRQPGSASIETRSSGLAGPPAGSAGDEAASDASLALATPD